MKPLTQQEQDWLNAYCNGTMTEEAFRAFETALLASASLRKQARIFLAMDASLRDVAVEQAIAGRTAVEAALASKPSPSLSSSSSSSSVSESSGPLERSQDSTPQTPCRRRSIWLFGALFAGVLFLLGIGAGTLVHNAPDLPQVPVVERSPDVENDGVATVKHAVHAVVLRDGVEQTLRQGAILSPGKFQMVRGEAVIGFYTGASLLVEGEVVLELKSPDEVICRNGRIRVYVPESAKGFRVISPELELVDLGTEFGVEVNADGNTEVDVFDGEVEVYPPSGNASPETLLLLSTGEGISWDDSDFTRRASKPGRFSTFKELEGRSDELSRERMATWKVWNEQIKQDSHVVAHYDFEDLTSTLLDRSLGRKEDGTVIGCEPSRGRWGGKGALDFKRPGDRVRLNIPGEFDQLSLAVWLRKDALTGRMQSLLLSDGIKDGHLRWQITPKGALRFGFRLSPANKKKTGMGYSVSPVFASRVAGTWNLAGVVCDRSTQQIIHYWNGKEIARNKIEYAGPIMIGAAEIGNWGRVFEKRPAQDPDAAIRNFQGRIDSLTIWNTALSAEDFLAIYQATQP